MESTSEVIKTICLMYAYKYTKQSTTRSYHQQLILNAITFVNQPFVVLAYSWPETINGQLIKKEHPIIFELVNQALNIRRSIERRNRNWIHGVRLIAFALVPL